MLFLTASAAAQPDYVALAMVIAIAVVVAIMTLRKYLSKKNPSQKLPVPASAPAAQFLRVDTLLIMDLGLIAFIVDTAGGIILSMFR